MCSTVPGYYFKYLELQGNPRDCISLPVSCACYSISLPALGLYWTSILKGREKMDFWCGICSKQGGATTSTSHLHNLSQGVNEGSLLKLLIQESDCVNQFGESRSSSWWIEEAFEV